jgi:Zn finger protein HypA/HybF involved in hydrogenase expression
MKQLLIMMELWILYKRLKKEMNEMQGKINSENFKVACNKCGSENVRLEIDWGSYMEGKWCNLEYICFNIGCNNKEIVYDYSD